MPVKVRVFLLRALFQTSSDIRVTLGIAEQMGKAGPRSRVSIIGLGMGGKKVSHMNAAER